MELYFAGNIRREDAELNLLKYNRLYSYFYNTDDHNNSHDLERRIKRVKKTVKVEYGRRK